MSSRNHSSSSHWEEQYVISTTLLSSLRRLILLFDVCDRATKYYSPLWHRSDRNTMSFFIYAKYTSDDIFLGIRSSIQCDFNIRFTFILYAFIPLSLWNIFPLNIGLECSADMIWSNISVHIKNKCVFVYLFVVGISIARHLFNTFCFFTQLGGNRRFCGEFEFFESRTYWSMIYELMTFFLYI